MVSVVGGVLAFAVLIGLTYRMARDADPTTALAAVAFVAIAPATSLEAVQGLETLLYAALVAGALLLRVREDEDATRFPFSAGLAALAALTRPEGVLIFALLEGLPVLAARSLTPLRGRWRGWLIFVAALGAHMAFRLGYYGQPLPNTFYAKVTSSGSQVFRGAGYLGAFALGHVPLVAFALAGAVRLLRTRGREARTALLVGLAGAYLLYVGAVGGDFKASYRSITPVWVPLALLAQVGVVALVERVQRPRAVLAAVLGVLVAATGVPEYLRCAAIAENRGQRLMEGLAMGAFIEDAYPDATLAIHAAGVIPYRSGVKTIDLWGLTDPHIARVEIDDMGEGLAGHEKQDYDYAFSREPDLYVPAAGFVHHEAIRVKVPAGFPEDFEQRYRQISYGIGEGLWANLYVRIEPDGVEPDGS